jgi:hypothetical protein
MICFDPVVNTGRLTDMGCPSCGCRDALFVGATAEWRVVDTGMHLSSTNTTWDLRSPCRCSRCSARGTVATFTHPGLDARIKAGITVPVPKVPG